MVEKKQYERPYRFMKMRLTGMIILLIVEYLFGMIVTIFSYAPDDLKAHPSLLGSLIMGAHALFGIVLVIGALFILLFSFKSQDALLKKIGLYGFIGVCLAFISGIATVALKGTASNISSLIMSLGFLLAIIAYWKYLYVFKAK